MADKDDDKVKKKKKSIIASLDLKNYKAKYTDSYGMGKPNEIDLDNFLIAEPDHNKEPKIEEKPEPKFDKSKQEKITQTQPQLKPQSQPGPEQQPQQQPKVQIEKQPQSDKKEITPQVNDSDFEKRINAEADNDFYNEKTVQKTAGTFRSNVIKKTIPPVQEDDKSIPDPIKKDPKSNRKLNLRDPITVNVRHEVKNINSEEENIEPVNIKEPPRRTETYGIIISAVAFVYSIIAKDKPLVFLSVSLLLYLARPIIAAPFGKYSTSVQNAIKGFSMALFFGAIFFIFF